MSTKNKIFRPELTSAGIEASYPVTVFDEFGMTRDTHITGERPLTIYIDKQEIVTLMTLGTVSYTHLTLPTIYSV